MTCINPWAPAEDTAHVLNALSTCAHVLKGKTYGNVMIDLSLSNTKLFFRGVDLLQRLLSLSSSAATHALLRAIHDLDEVHTLADTTLLFEPGTQWRYSNYGYQLVGAVVEAAAGEPYLEFMDREVFTPAGMEQTVPACLRLCIALSFKIGPKMMLSMR